MDYKRNYKEFRIYKSETVIIWIDAILEDMLSTSSDIGPVRFIQLV